jgi:pimeloyl-ACP methyl ester carboxylesterase
VNTECATLEVPLDYSHPDGDTIQIAVSRVAASDPARRIGVMLLNPGGPGAPGRSQAPDWRDGLSAQGHPSNGSEVLARFDLMGFDPRGIGASTPVVGCGDVKAYHAVTSPERHRRA